VQGGKVAFPQGFHLGEVVAVLISRRYSDGGFEGREPLVAAGPLLIGCCWRLTQALIT
jgi:hypothetical protein